MGDVAHRGRALTCIMTHTIPEHTAGTAARVAIVACTVGGVAFIIDTVTITVINSNFGTADDVLFFAGLIAFAVALGALALHLSSPSRGARRMVRTVATFLALLIGLGTFSLLMDAFGRRAFSEANIGLHG